MSGAAEGGVVDAAADGTDLVEVIEGDLTAADVVLAEAPAAGDGRGTGRWWGSAGMRRDLLVVGGYLLMAVYVTQHLWWHLKHYALAVNATDQIQAEFFMRHAAQAVLHGQNPFFTDRLNAPDGVNLMANTVALGLHIPFLPVTLLFGAQATLAAELTFGLAATAAAWYWLFSRHLVRSRLAAVLAGGFCGFAPGMISQANGHPNITAQFLIPLIIWRVLRLGQPGRVLRNGVLLALLVIYQVFLNEELLFVTALGMVVFLAVWARRHREQARARAGTFARSLGTAALISLAALAYPLYWQFFGPQSYHGMPTLVAPYGNDLFGFVGFARQSFAGFERPASSLSANPTEQNSFFGWPLAVLIGYLAVHFRRNEVARAAGIAGALLAVLSLGPHLVVGGVRLGIPGLYAPLLHLPVFDSAITSRLVLLAIPVVAMYLALWVDEWLTWPFSTRQERVRGRLVALGLVAAAVLPVVPTPLPVGWRAATPVFFTSGEWRSYVPAGYTVVTVPVTSLNNALDGMQWAADVHLGFSQAGGYFIGPDARGEGRFGAVPRPTATLLNTVLVKGSVPAITQADRDTALADLRYWRAAIVVMSPQKRHGAQLLRTVSELLGFAPSLIDGVWVWNVTTATG